MKKTEDKPDNSRRKFLQGVASTGAGTAVAALIPGSATAAAEQSEPEKKPQGYRLTQHILDYYKSTAS
ncbi:MAG: twin-arginine translocation signal domain-containing protein [Gammaproteobacteria bacterium]|jgi:nitrous oxide reductase